MPRISFQPANTHLDCGLRIHSWLVTDVNCQNRAADVAHSLSSPGLGRRSGSADNTTTNRVIRQLRCHRPTKFPSVGEISNDNVVGEPSEYIADTEPVISGDAWCDVMCALFRTYVNAERILSWACCRDTYLQLRAQSYLYCNYTTFMALYTLYSVCSVHAYTHFITHKWWRHATGGERPSLRDCQLRT